MSVLISGALINGAGVPMAECKIYLDALVNTSEVVTESFAVIETDAAGQYAFEAQKGKYTVHIKQKNGPKCCVGDIAVYDDSKPGTLNDFLTALDEGDLKPDVVKRFEELVAQAQQSAEAAAKSERLAEQHVTDAQNIKDDCQTLADNVQQNAESVTEDKKQVAQLASSAKQGAARAEQAVKDADLIVQKAVDKLGEAATLTGEAKASAEAAAKSEQNAKQHRDEAQRIVDDLKGSNASTTQKGLVQLCSDTDNDSEELAATPKAVKTVMDETKTKAPLDSPAFTGTPTTPTPPDDAVGLETANAAFVRKLLAALVDSSPEALDTLNELAAALGNDPEFATTIMNALAGKQPLSDVLTAISNLEERADNLLCFNQDGNASLSPLSEKARSLLAQATVEAMRTELELKSAAVKDIQTDIYDSTEGRVALPGAYGYGMTDAGARSIIASDMATIARTAHNTHPGRYYTFSTQTEETTGITEIIWLDNNWGDKTSLTATKLVLFFGKDGRILMTVRGDNISAPVTWTNLTPQLGNAAQKDAQENIYDRTEGRLAIPGMFGFGKVFSSGDRTEFKTEADFLRWVKTAKPGRYAVYGADKVIPGVLFSGTVEIIWPEPQTNPNPVYVAKIIIFYGINGHVYYNRYWTAGDGYLIGWENLKVNEASLIAQIEARAPLKSPALTGTPTAPTPPDDAAGTEIANAAFVRKLLAALVGSSPEALDTLNELAAALGNDPNFATTVTNALAGKQPLNEILTSLSGLVTAGNKLPYFSDKNVMALANLTAVGRVLIGQNSKNEVLEYLGLKAAATMEPQSDIRDRTSDRVALPGAFGFGYAFSQSERLDFNSDEKFLEWVKSATDGRYFVYSYNSNLFPDGDSFMGVVDVVLFPTGGGNGNPAETNKGLFFYSRYQPNSEQAVFYAQYSSAYANGIVTWGLTSVRNLSLTPKMLSEYLSSTAGAGTYFQYPGIGVPVLAVYRGTATGDKEIRIGLGDVVHGSCLGSVNITCSISAMGVFSSTPRVGASAYSFPGRYMAISGDRGSYGEEGHICLFVRIE
ncbi:prophage tail fiber N-terminal domain-containing protein [Escherichia albertii]|uniref:prophage tail fiber N-terminal domain-containing protein n=1 Tax=Escherichia albertii TaxID=208962 RepID=UPI00195B53EE|nr:prophage tail fiber N-terminal domain-containing protein [Escherichia albertii]QST27413.1 prophage tail fiber N-terminal domain-containing protein [Escherichia albertii]QST36780.1 prophage tail fiber N-terminal domain-containing protein [Escherichia albertii]